MKPRLLSLSSFLAALAMNTSFVRHFKSFLMTSRLWRPECLISVSETASSGKYPHQLWLFLPSFKKNFPLLGSLPSNTWLLEYGPCTQHVLRKTIRSYPKKATSPQLKLYIKFWDGYIAFNGGCSFVSNLYSKHKDVWLA